MVNMGLDLPDAQKFLWVGNGEPHGMRRRLILAKYGEKVRRLYGYDHATAWQVVFVVLVQLYMGYIVKDWSWGAILVAGYLISGTANQNLLSAQHEISHCLAFRRPLYNKILALASNIVLVVPVAVKFREYHHDHHLFLGVDGGDVDLPTVYEASAVANLAAKLAWGVVYILVYGIRPLIVRPKAMHSGDVVNYITTIGFCLTWLYFFGIKPIIYWFLGTLLGGSLLHPLGGHLLSEHYMFVKGQETYSYYGPLNALTYNVGYHNEHHDFPQIPHTRLHKLREIAPEFYQPMYAHHSWCWVLWRFFADPAVGPWLRVHRLVKEGPCPAANARFNEYDGLHAVWNKSAVEGGAVPEGGAYAPVTRGGGVSVANVAAASAPSPRSPSEASLSVASAGSDEPQTDACSAPLADLNGQATEQALRRWPLVGKRASAGALPHGRHGSSEENAAPSIVSS